MKYVAKCFNDLNIMSYFLNNANVKRTDIIGIHPEHNGYTVLYVESDDTDNEDDRWIPLSEKLPEIQQNVLLTLKDRPFDNMVVGFRMTNKPWFYIYCAGSGRIEPEMILAWMPLPEPYKEDEENETN